MAQPVTQSLNHPFMAPLAARSSLPPDFGEATVGGATLSRERAITRRLVLSGPAGFFAA
jgi:hypothetical protein